MTTASQTQSRDRKNGAPQRPQDICGTLLDLGQAGLPPAQYFHEALVDIAAYFSASYTAVSVVTPTGSFDDRVTHDQDDSWRSVVDAALLDAQSNFEPNAQVYTSHEDPNAKIAVIAVPIDDGMDEPAGAIAVVIACPEPAVAKAKVAELRALASLLVVQTRTTSVGPTEKGNQAETYRALGKAAEYNSRFELAYAFVNRLKSKLECDLVAMGQVFGRRAEVLAISGFDNVKSSTPGVKIMRQAMEECLDRGAPICYQLDDRWEEETLSSNHQLHMKWHAEMGNASVVSVPLMVDETVIAVVSLTRPEKEPFKREEVEKLQEMMTPFAPGIMLVARANRTLPTHLKDSCRNGVRWMFAPGRWGRKVLTLAMLAGLGWFCLGTREFVVTVPCKVTPTQIHNFGAPFEGSVKAVHVDVGDRVVAGQLLYEMDTTQLELERARLASERAITALKSTQAVNVGDLNAAALANAETKVVEAQLASVEQRLKTAKVIAPSDGMIVEGELDQRIGEAVPMGEMLMKFTPQSTWSLELRVPEKAAVNLAGGQAGQFASNALPSIHESCQITSIRPVSEAFEGSNVYIVDALVDGDPDWIRFGMEGVTKVEVGQKPVWWITLHEAINWVRLKLWI